MVHFFILFSGETMKKIFQVTLLVFIVLVAYTVSNISVKDRVLRTNLEISDISHINTTKIYYLNNNNLLVGVDTFIDGDDSLKKIESIISYLKKESVNNGYLNGYLPKKLKVLNIKLNDGFLELDLSKDILDTSYDIELVKTGLVYSILELDDVEEISISVDGQYLKGFTKIFNKKMGINTEYILENRKDVLKVVVYYLDDTSNYYVPVTKYLNNKSEKIEVIINELKDNNDNRLVSLLDKGLELIDYQEVENVMFLNFNDYILNDNKEVQEKIYNMVSYSVFDNYDVSMVMFEVNGKAIKQIKKSSM